MPAQGKRSTPGTVEDAESRRDGASRRRPPSRFDDFVRAVFRQLAPGTIVDDRYRVRLCHWDGLTEPSQRLEAIEGVEHYLFDCDPSRDLPAIGYGYEQERQWALDEFLRARNNSQSEEINRRRADAFAQVERAANWRPAHCPREIRADRAA